MSIFTQKGELERLAVVSEVDKEKAHWWIMKSSYYIL
jgi:hypothetical protein